MGLLIVGFGAFMLAIGYFVGRDTEKQRHAKQTYRRDIYKLAEEAGQQRLQKAGQK